jgi:uncharacterized repeat protein (TIGR01451 family)
VGDILPGGQRSITATYSVPLGTPAGTYTNTVNLSSVGATAPITATDVNTVAAASADLGITKSDGVTQVTAGDGVIHTYAITLANSGPSLASGVVITDTWPVGFTRGVVSITPGSCDTQTSPTDFTCAVGNILPGGQRIITVTYSVPPGTPAGTKTNTAQVGSLVDDANLGNNSISENTQVITRADLSLTKLDNPDPVNSGEILTYTLSVANNGPSDALGVILTDSLPNGTTFSIPGTTPGCNAVGSLVTCNLGGIAAGSSLPVVIKALVNLPAGGTIHNVANVTASTVDLVPGNNQATADTFVDVGNPVVNWLQPVPNLGYFYVKCQPVCPLVHFEVTATDDIGVNKVKFQRWDHVIGQWVQIGEVFSQPYAWEFDTSVLPFGYNQIWVWAYDAFHESLGKRIFLVKLHYIYLPVTRR